MIYQNSVAEPRQEINDVIMESVTTDEMFVGLKIFPPAPLKLLQAHVPKINIAIGDLMRGTAGVRKPGAAFARWQSGITDHSITMLQTPEELLIPDEEMMTYEDFFALEQVYSKEATNRLRRFTEVAIAAVVQNTANWTNANSSVAYTNANLATMTPSQDFILGIRAVKAAGQLPNTIVIPGQVYDRIRVCADMKSWIAGSINPGARVTANNIQASFSDMGIKQVLVADGYVNTSEQELNASIVQIWNNLEVWIGEAQPGQLLSGGAGRTWFWEKEGPLFNIQTYRDETRKSNVIRAITTQLPDIINARCGYLVNTQYS